MRAIIVIILMLSINCLAINDTKVPKLTFVGKRIVNFGIVKEGKIIEQKIYFTNTGDSLLIVKDITKSCNCTEVMLKERKTCPKDTNYMSVTVDTKGKVGINIVDIVLNTNTQQKEHIAKLIMEVEK